MRRFEPAAASGALAEAVGGGEEGGRGRLGLRERKGEVCGEGERRRVRLAAS